MARRTVVPQPRREPRFLAEQVEVLDVIAEQWLEGDLTAGAAVAREDPSAIPPTLMRRERR